MLLIKCPWCGERAQTEFIYKGDANARRPSPKKTSDNEWFNYLFLRKNPKGSHDEFWQHTSGCRQFLIVRRNVVTHKIIAVFKTDEIVN